MPRLVAHQLRPSIGNYRGHCKHINKREVIRMANSALNCPWDRSGLVSLILSTPEGFLGITPFRVFGGLPWSI